MPHNNPPMANFDEEGFALYQKATEKIDVYRMATTAAIEAKDYENAMLLIWDAAQKLYLMNQTYTDDFFELALLHLNEIFTKDAETSFEAKENTLLYYDRVADDNHGLTPIFLNMFGKLGLKIVYLAPFTHISHIPKIKHIIKEYGGEIVTFRRKSMLDTYNQISDAILNARPKYAFFYAMPQDAPGALAFMRFKGSVTRYFVDITDHAFWLGRNACDYVLQGRDYGASINYLYRGIPLNRIIEFHDSPEFSISLPFHGFPFDKKQDDFVIFSGGAPYKIEDENLTFYNMVANILANHKNVKFWYAGKTDSDGMTKLIEAFPDRVFNTDLRKDLIPILKNVDMYLNTYPMFGGTMMRLAAHAGHPPFTLKFNDEARGMLKNQSELGIEFDTPDELFYAVHKFITDEGYRTEMKARMKDAFYTEEEMEEYMRNALLNPTPYAFNAFYPETRDFRAWHLKRHIDEILK